jgi:hypothetical protein
VLSLIPAWAVFEVLRAFRVSYQRLGVIESLESLEAWTYTIFSRVEGYSIVEAGETLERTMKKCCCLRRERKLQSDHVLSNTLQRQAGMFSNVNSLHSFETWVVTEERAGR